MVATGLLGISIVSKDIGVAINLKICLKNLIIKDLNSLSLGVARSVHVYTSAFSLECRDLRIV